MLVAAGWRRSPAHEGSCLGPINLPFFEGICGSSFDFNMAVRIAGGLTEKGVVVGNTYDKYGSNNAIARWLMCRFEKGIAISCQSIWRIRPSRNWLRGRILDDSIGAAGIYGEGI